MMDQYDLNDPLPPPRRRTEDQLHYTPERNPILDTRPIYVPKSDLAWLMRESAIVQGVIALVSVAGIVYMYVIGREVPAELLAIVTLILGYYFGAKVVRRGQY